MAKKKAKSTKRMEKELQRLRAELEIMGGLLAQTQEKQRKAYLKKHPEIAKLLKQHPELAQSRLLFPRFEEKEAEQAWKKLTAAEKSAIRKAQVEQMIGAQNHEVMAEQIIAARMELAELDGYVEHELGELADEYEMSPSEIYTIFMSPPTGKAA